MSLTHPASSWLDRLRRALLPGLLGLATLVAACGGKLSDDASLEALAVSSGSLIPAFDPDVLVYNLSVDNAVDTITVTPRSTDADATVTVRGGRVERGSASAPVALVVGSNTINVVVTSESDTEQRTYVLRVERLPAGASSSAALVSLAVSAGTLDPSFSPETTRYALSVANGVDTLSVRPVSGQSPTRITVDGQTVADGADSQALSLVVGANPAIEIVVLSQDGSTQRTYTLTVTRAAL